MSLLSLCKKRIVEEIISPVHAMSASGSDGYLTMVVDQFTLKVISSSCSFYDIIEAGVTIVEQLHSKREPLRKMDCIYFITGNKRNLERVQRDYEGGGMYRSAHLFVTGFRGERISGFDILSNHDGLLRKLLTFKEVNLDFIPYDSRTFYIDNEGLFKTSLDLSEKLQQQIMSGINTLCKTLGINTKPIIRYQNCGRVEVSAECKNFADKLNNLQNGSAESSEECTILLLDRSFDAAPLYIHDYHYQALAYDLLKIPVSLSNPDNYNIVSNTRFENTDFKSSDNQKMDDVYEYEISSTGGKKETKKAVLDERDSKWVLYRHDHIGNVNQAITDETLKFTHNNVTAKIHRGNNKESNISTSETIQVVRTLPQYQQTLSRYWTHISLIGECYDILKKNDITSIGEIEQCIATMLDSDGKSLSATKQRSNLLAVLGNSTLGRLDEEFPVIKDSNDKLRLILLYISHYTGVSNDDLNQLIDFGKLSNDDQIVLKKLLGLGLCNSFEDIATGNGKHIHKYEISNKERVKYFKQRLRNIEINLSRFEPLIKTIVYHLLCQLNIGNNSIISYNTFNQKNFNEDFPCVGKSNTNEGPYYLLGNFNHIQSHSFSLPRYSLNRKVVIVFVLGSITFPEIRCIYELMNESNSNIYIGGINITTPTQLINQVLYS
ncbi:syntaxin binding protein [Cryptosporidium ubiquitum]|uniref:Syntaxin binding protein n=1 Tax=Cryptosporidium ubiquitum TaxID=857276 RepID=A0A1J4MGK8_9CRYT|nr:syntaxin binding protein [Cryptosporidium ubiquitum]OII72595.1 syntaxin binding protein [Cryptosporidium ubiquitum]